MLLQVDLKEFWLDEESDIVPALKRHVVQEVAKALKEEILKLAKFEIEKAIKMQIDETFTSEIDKEVASFVATGLVKGKHTNKEMNVREYINDLFQYNGWGSLQETIKKLAIQHSDNLKKTYDLQFASHIVTRMRENGLLKEDVAKLLLEQPDK